MVSLGVLGGVARRARGVLLGKLMCCKDFVSGLVHLSHFTRLWYPNAHVTQGHVDISILLASYLLLIHKAEVGALTGLDVIISLKTRSVHTVSNARSTCCTEHTPLYSSVYLMLLTLYCTEGYILN